MAKPNYSFQKRQKEIAKKKKREAKLLQKKALAEEQSQNIQPESGDLDEETTTDET